MAYILAEIKADNTEAEEWLIHYHERRKQFYIDKNEAMYSTIVPDVPIRSGPGNPTLQKAMTLTRLLHMERWLETVEIVEGMLGEKKLILLLARREAAHIVRQIGRGRPAWVVYVQRRYAEEMGRRYNAPSERFWLSETTVKNWWNQIVELSARVAIKRGCFKNII